MEGKLEQIEWRAAKDQGLRHYFTGQPCKRGHVAKRLTSTRACCVCAAEAATEFNRKNRPAHLDAIRRWRARNPEAFAAQNKRRSAKDGYAVQARMRSSLYKALQGKKAGRAWEAMIGYTLADLMSHLERQFIGGMSWENMGEWHIDHIIPKSRFDATDEGQLKACWALPNLRPLWGGENMRKHAKVTTLL